MRSLYAFFISFIVANSLSYSVNAIVTRGFLIEPIDTIPLVFQKSGYQPDSTLDGSSFDTVPVRHSFFQTTEETSIDTVVVANDTTKIDYPLESPIYTVSKDSLLYSVDGKMVYLYGEAVVKYENMELNAAYIEFNMETKVVYAEGRPDSTGAIMGKPVFKDGGQVFTMDRMHYNFDSKRAKIYGVITEEAGGFLHSHQTKLMDDNTVNVSGGKFTTCDLEHPHFYIGITKGKVIPDDKLIIGPAYIVIGDVPLPIGIPFGFFPNKKGRSSGIILPEFGEEQNRGFNMSNGGFYFGISDYFDLKLTGDIYSKGSWAFNARSFYKKRYKFSGNFHFSLSENIFGEKGQDDYIRNSSYNLRWNHSKDPKSSPNSTFQASVNIGTPNHNRYNATSVDAFLTNTMSSSISYSKVWPGTPFSMSSTMNHSQNNLDSSITLGLPRVSFNMSRIYPLKRKSSIGTPRWYENIGLSYSTRLENSISTRTDKLFTEDSFDKFRNGMQHNVPLSTSFNVLKFVIVSPSTSYTESWYTRTIEKHWDEETKKVVVDTISGFRRAWQYNAGINASTKVYGMFNFKGGFPIQAIRHVVTPSVGLSYRPDFSEDFYGFYRDVQIDTTGKTARYSIFEQTLFGGPPSGKSGAVNFQLGNNLEMKVRSSKDTTSNFRKIKILESFNFSTSYNLLADSMNWSPVSFSGRTTLFEKVNVSLSGQLDPYALDQAGSKYDYFQYHVDGSPFRLTSARVSVGFATSGGSTDGSSGSRQQGAGSFMMGPDTGDPMFGESLGASFGDADYVDFSVPWTLRLDYSFSYTKPRFEKNTIQSVSFSGDLSLTPKWKIGFSSGYDFKKRQLTTTALNFFRDLHCWEMSLAVVPVGYLKSFSFRINVKSATLKDLKWSKRESYQDNF